MTTPDPNAITFTDLRFEIAEGKSFILYECGKCGALVRTEKVQDHATWHGKLGSEVKMASLGFGGLGV